MRKLLLCVGLLLVGTSEVLGQNVTADRLRFNVPGTTGCTARAGSGSPEGVVTGVTCDTYEDLTTGHVYKKIGTGTTGWLMMAGPSSATCATFAGCVAQSFALDSLTTTWKNRADPSKQFRLSVLGGSAGTRLESYNGGGWAPLRLNGGPLTTRSLYIGTSDIIDPGEGNFQLSGHIGLPGYVSQTTGWRIDGLGAADFRYLYTDELHAKKFIADLEQALAGLQIIAKSVGQIGAEFTVPAPGSISTLTMRDLPSAANMAIFESGDYVWIRQFSRAGGSLSITNGYGIVTGYTDLADGLQSWQFTRLVSNGGSMSTGAVIEVDSIVLDVGVPGNGWIETNAIDGLYGINSPYTQVVTWSGNSPISANQTLRTRMGNLRGITGVTGEYGFIAGTYAATNGTYVRASNQAFELHGIDLKLWSGSTNVYRLDHLTPYQSMGNPAPTTYSSGTGCWSGMDAGVFKWRCGDIAGGTQYIAWNGTQLTVAGNIVVTGTSIDASTVNGVSGATVVSGAQRALLGITAAGNPALPAVAAPSGSGLFLGSDYMGYFTGGAWQTYMTNTGNFYLGGTGGALTYVASTNTLTVSGTLSGPGSGITSINGGNIQTGTVTATQINVSSLSALTTNTGTLTVGSGGYIRSGATDFTTGTGYWVDYNAGSPRFRIGNPSGKRLLWDGSDLELISGAVTIDDGSITITAGTSFENRYNFSDGSYFTSSGDFAVMSAQSRVSIDINGSEKFRQTSTVSEFNTNIEANGNLTVASVFSLDSPGTTTSNDYPLVWSVDQIVRRKTDGADGTFCTGFGVASITIERGIVVGVTCF